MPPVVSVIIPTYNRQALLPRAIDSVVRQTFSDWEIVLVDDGSTDDTPRIAARYLRQLGRRFIFLRQENRGASAARNAGIETARGEYIAFLDSDDEFVPHKLARQMALLEKRPQLGMVYSDYSFIDLDGRFFASAFATKCRLARQVPRWVIGDGLAIVDGSLFDTLIHGYFVSTIVGMVRREVLGSDLRFATDINYSEEWLFYLEVSRRCACGFVDEPLSLHHFTRNSLARHDKSGNTRAYAALLRRILARFDGDLSFAQRRSLCGQLAATLRQLGYDAECAGDLAAAARGFWRAFSTRPNWRDAANSIGCVLRLSAQCLAAEAWLPAVR